MALKEEQEVYNIKLTKDQMDYLYFEYDCVEVVVEDIQEQAKKQGYKEPKL